MKAILILLLFPVTCLAQSVKIQLRKQIAPAGLVFLAGAADGVNQAVSFKYPSFKRTFPGINDKWWNPKISGGNKYKDGKEENGAKFFGSKTFLVATTDAYHASRLLEHLLVCGAIAIKIGEGKKKWYIYGLEAISYWIINRIGFCLVYDRF